MQLESAVMVASEICGTWIPHLWIWDITVGNELSCHPCCSSCNIAGNSWGWQYFHRQGARQLGTFSTLLKLITIHCHCTDMHKSSQKLTLPQ